VPGPTLQLGNAAFVLDVDEAFDGHDGLEAYERLLHDVMLGERLLFTRAEQIERLWEVVQPVLDDPPTPEPYAQGSWGPEAALRLPGGVGWRLQADAG
jgi:glucose-6-phosphate 1-dehydrogenase